MTWVIIALAIIIAGWLIARALSPAQPTDVNADVRMNENTELSKLIYKFALEKKTDTQIIADPTVSELVRLKFKGMDLQGLTIADLVTPMTISGHKKSLSYFMTNKTLAKRLKNLFAKGYDDKKIASELCRLEGLQVQNPELSYLHDDYHSFDITRMRVDSNFMFMINNVK